MGITATEIIDLWKRTVGNALLIADAAGYFRDDGIFKNMHHHQDRLQLDYPCLAEQLEAIERGLAI